MSEAEIQDIQTDSQNKFVEDGKNKLVIKCKFCGSKMLDKKTAAFVTLEMELPLIQQDTRKKDKVETEMLKEFYRVENIYTFENIGFTNTVKEHKYLSCADCDVGPVGYHENSTKHSYVALSRIEHE